MRFITDRCNRVVCTAHKAGNLSIGYFCDLDGDDQVRLDENELASAEWFDRNDLPAKDDGISLTREMIRIFGEGREPK